MSSSSGSDYRGHTADATSSSVQISSLSHSSGHSRRGLQSTTSVKVKLGGPAQSKFDSRAHRRKSDDESGDEKSRIRQIVEAAKEAGISLEALTRAKDLFRGYRNVSEVHSWEMGLIYCKFVTNYDEKKEAKEADEKNEGVCKRISKKFCSTRYPLFGKEGLDKHDDFDIIEDKECCCGRILYRTHNRINNYIMFLQHHKMEFLTLKLLIELAKLKHNLGYRMYTNFMSRKILLFVSMLLMPFLILLSMMTLDSRNAYILSGSSDIFSYMTMWKYFYLALCIPLYYIFVCLSIARLDFNRQICYAGIFMVLGIAILSRVTLLYLKEIKYLPIKPNYRLEQFRQAISRWDVDECSRYIVNSTQRKYRCCGLESYRDYYDDVNFEYSNEVKVSDNSENLDQHSKDTSNTNINKEKLINKKKIPASCFTSKINATMFRINKRDKITPFGFGDGCAKKIIKHTSKSGLLSNSHTLVIYAMFAMLLIILMPYTLYTERNDIVLLFMISETLRTKSKKVLDANAEAFRMYNAEHEAPGVLEQEIGPQLQVLVKKLEYAENILCILSAK